jgi:hypothetical protein
LEQQLDAVQGAGFDGFTAQLGPRHAREAEKRGLLVVGYFSSGDEERFADLLKSQKDAGAHHVNVQLADHDTEPADALRLTLRLIEEAERIGGLAPSIEVHRDTCTETPEKTYALADGYFKATGELLPMTWDFSHLAVVKHLAPEMIANQEIINATNDQIANEFGAMMQYYAIGAESDRTTDNFLQWLVEKQSEEVALLDRLLQAVQGTGESDLFRVKQHLAHEKGPGSASIELSQTVLSTLSSLSEMILAYPTSKVGVAAGDAGSIIASKRSGVHPPETSIRGNRSGLSPSRLMPGSQPTAA